MAIMYRLICTLQLNQILINYRVYKLPFRTDLKNTHPTHVEPVVAFCLNHTNEDIVTGWAAYNRPHAVHIGSEFTNSISYAAACTGCLNERHFKGENFL